MGWVPCEAKILTLSELETQPLSHHTDHTSALTHSHDAHQSLSSCAITSSTP
jgi:hypothetical protein